MFRHPFHLLVLLCLSAGSLSAAAQNNEINNEIINHELREPPVFSSSNRLLDLLMVAKPKPMTLGSLSTTAWVYETCTRSVSVNDQCPGSARTFDPYGGIRLQLQPGDHLKIRLVNQLPPAPADWDRVREDPEMFGANPTNLHTHGLIVEPRRAGNGDPTYGDYVYVLGYPAGQLPGMIHPGMDSTDKPIDYDIYIPPNHPSGSFWFHPHTHGISLNQVSQGLAGIITIGNVSDYVNAAGAATLRHLILKDIEVNKDGSVTSQEDPGYCDSDPVAGEPDRLGSCPGIAYTDDDGNYVDHTGGAWFNTINGQVYPTIHVAPGRGEIWSMTNASGSRSYDLHLLDDASHRPLTFQVLSIDGIALDPPSGTNMQALAKELGNKIIPTACPGNPSAVCTTGIRMMPATRVELYLPPAPSFASASATFLTQSYPTGPEGDDWPMVKLAHVIFVPNPGRAAQAALASTSLQVKGESAGLLRPDGLLGAPAHASFAGLTHAIPLQLAVQISNGKPSSAPAFDPTTTNELRALTPTQLRNLRQQVLSLEDPNCKALAPGHRRRIFFGVPTGPSDGFGLGYEELDAHGNPVPGTFEDIAPFDHSNITVCLPLERGNRQTTERWQMVNVSGEDHNFHIHQTKFKVLSGSNAREAGNLMDSVPVPHGSDACDGTIDTWRSGACRVRPVEVSIPFTQVGDFVYHCHILEHEDGGMMAHIRVVANPW